MSVELIAESDRYVFTCSYEERQIPKGAGFRWDPERKLWWTSRTENAAKLCRYAGDEKVAAELQAIEKQREESLEASRAMDADLEIPAPEGLEYLPFQRAGIAYAKDRDGMLLADEMGLGKAQPLNANVLTPVGWKRMGDMAVGDPLVNSQGGVSNVVGVFPQGRQEIVELVFSDGATTRATLDHLWYVEARHTFRTGARGRVLTTAEISKRGLREADGRYRFAVPLPAPIKLPNRELPLAPYLLGVFLGNGCSTGNNTIIGLNPVDREVRDNIAAALPQGGLRLRQVAPYAYQIAREGATWQRNEVKEALRSLGILGLRAWEKHVPSPYLLGSVEQRLALLQGLMDTDGTAQKSRNASVFYSTSQALATGVVHLSRSLGGVASTSSWIGRLNGKDHRRVYGVSVALPSPLNPFRLARKAQVLKRRTNKPVRRKIVAISRVGCAVVRCLAVDAPDGLYITDDFVVTHNTIQAIGLMNTDPSMARALVVSPASLKIVWKRELQKWLVHDLTVEVASSREPFPAHADIVVINYDILSKFRELFVPGGEKRYRYAGPEYDILIVDEAQAIKSSKARRSKLVRKIKAKKKLLLTGTPIVNRPIELWNLVNFLDPKTWHNFWFYAHRFCAARHNGFGWDLSGASNLEELQRKLRETVMVRRLKKDVLTELPPKIRQIIELPANGHRGYIEAEQVALRRREQQIEDARVRLELAKASGSDEEYRAAVTNLRECARVAFEDVARVRRETAVAKLDDAIPFLRDAVESSGKVVAFAHHHVVIEGLAEEFGDRAVVVYGATALEERQERVDRFQNDPGCVLFIGSIQAAGVGLTLTAASHVVFLELDWVPGNMSQAEDRLHRISQQNSVLVQHLVLEDSIDARLAKTLIAKQAVIDRALDERIEAHPTEAEEVLVPEAGRGESVNTRRKDLAREGAELSPEQVEAVHAALRQLAAVCDGATSLDGMGFNKIDTRVGRSLAGAERLSPRQAALGRRIVMKYRRQLPEELVQTIGKAG